MRMKRIVGGDDLEPGEMSVTETQQSFLLFLFEFFCKERNQNNLEKLRPKQVLLGNEPVTSSFRAHCAHCWAPRSSINLKICILLHYDFLSIGKPHEGCIIHNSCVVNSVNYKIARIFCPILLSLDSRSSKIDYFHFYFYTTFGEPPHPKIGLGLLGSLTVGNSYFNY